jgi:hypothetical protein
MINGSHSSSIEAIRLDEQDAPRRAIERKQKQETRTIRTNEMQVWFLAEHLVEMPSAA